MICSTMLSISLACTHAGCPRHVRFMRARSAVTPCCRRRSQGMQTVSKSLASCPGTRHRRKTASSCAGSRAKAAGDSSRRARFASTAADNCGSARRLRSSENLIGSLAFLTVGRASPHSPCRWPMLATAAALCSFWLCVPLSLLLLFAVGKHGRCRAGESLMEERRPRIVRV
jgi:hypothetical protein